MRIGIVCPNFPPATFEGGISHYSQILAEQLRKRNHEVIGIGTSEFANDFDQSSRQSEIKTIRISGPWNFKSVLKIRKLCNQLKLDCIILQFSPALYKKTFRLMWAFTPFNCGKIASFHTLWGKGFDRFYGMLILAGSNKIIATNSEIISIIERRMPFLLKKTYWIPIGSNIVPQSITQKVEYDKIPTISYFGMIYPGKGLDLILDVINVLKKREHKFKFKFIGGAFLDYKFYQNEFNKKIQAKCLNDCVEYLGRIKSAEVSYWLAKSRFIFLPYEIGLSDRRGSFMAAIAHGKAVLTSPPIVKIPFLKNGVNALWPARYSVDSYIKLAENLLKKDCIIKRLERGASAIAPFFDWGKISFEYECALLDS